MMEEWNLLIGHLRYGMPFWPGAAPFLFRFKEEIISSIFGGPILKGLFGSAGLITPGGVWQMNSRIVTCCTSIPD